MRFKGVSGLLQHVEVVCVRGSFFRLLWTGSVPLVDTVRASHEVLKYALRPTHSCGLALPSMAAGPNSFELV
jgi:hypothetical protein